MSENTLQKRLAELDAAIAAAETRPRPASDDPRASPSRVCQLCTCTSNDTGATIPAQARTVFARVAENGDAVMLQSLCYDHGTRAIIRSLGELADYMCQPWTHYTNVPDTITLASILEHNYMRRLAGGLDVWTPETA